MLTSQFKNRRLFAEYLLHKIMMNLQKWCKSQNQISECSQINKCATKQIFNWNWKQTTMTAFISAISAKWRMWRGRQEQSIIVIAASVLAIILNWMYLRVWISSKFFVFVFLFNFATPSAVEYSVNGLVLCFWSMQNDLR